jgi:hypothetical protein
MEMARIVQAADFKDQLDDHPAARGLQLISQGFPLVTKADQDNRTAPHSALPVIIAVRAAFVYDSLYASIQSNITASNLTHGLHGWILCKIEIIVIALLKK